MSDRTSFFSKKVLLLNVIMTITILLLHSVPVIRCGIEFNLENSPFIYSTFMLCQIAVPMFFFLSGLLFYKTCTYSNLLKKLKSRFFSLVIPYLLWCTIFMTIYLIIGSLPFLKDKLNNSYEFESIIDTILAILNGRYTDLWFVKFLIFYVALSPILIFLLSNKYLSFIVLIGVGIYAYTNNFYYFSLYTWLFVYIQGAIVGKYFLSEKNECYGYFSETDRLKKIILAILLLVVFMGMYVMTVFYSSYAFIFWVISPIVLWVLYDLIAYKFTKYKFLPKQWMTYTFFIFCSHHFIINVYQKISLIILPHNDFVMVFLFLTSPIVAFFIIIIIIRLIYKYPIYKYLSGGR